MYIVRSVHCEGCLLWDTVQVHLKKVIMVKKFVFACNLFQKVKLSSDVLNATLAQSVQAQHSRDRTENFKAQRK